MRTLEKVREAFPVGAEIEVVEHTRRPELIGQRRRVTAAFKNHLDVEVLSGHRAGSRGFRMALPQKASSVLAMSCPNRLVAPREVSYRIDNQHHATFRRCD